LTAGIASALVSGSSGFIGGHLVERLAGKGVAVTAIDLTEPKHSTPEGSRHVSADIRDAGTMRDVLGEVRPQAVFHLAAQASVTVSMREPALDIETNVVGTVNVALAAAAAGVRRLVFFSTGGALYGSPETLPVDEDAPKRVQSVYGHSKFTAEQYLALIAPAAGLEVAVIRPANVYGPRQDPHGEAGVVAIFAQRMLRGEAPTIFGDGSQLRDYVYVDDIVNAAVQAADGSPLTCNAGTGIPTSTREVYDAVAAAAGFADAPVLAPERPGDAKQIALDSTRAREAWGWEPAVGFEDGVARTVQWFRDSLSATSG
jgi:UDP-glucose 4-epimerase